MSVAMPRTMTRGVVFVHSTPAALCPHITWAIEGALGCRVTFDWTRQPAGQGLVRTEISWTGEVGTGARIASALRSFGQVRYEVTEEPTPGNDGSRWTHTPSLGIHRTQLSANGDAVLTESQLREIITVAQGSAEALVEMIVEQLGGDHDTELEVFRYAGEGAPVRWLHKVG